MTVAVDVCTEGTIRTGTGSPSTFSHAGGASGVKGVLVSLVNNGSAVNSVTAVSYGGVALSRVAMAADDSGEAGVAQWWFVGSGLSGVQGTQTVSYTTGSTGDDFQPVCITLTGAGDLAVVGQRTLGVNTTNPSVTVPVLGHNSMCFCNYFSGLAAPGDITDGAGITRLQDHDFGQQTAIVVRETTAAATDFTFSFTASSDDVAIAAIAVTDALVNQDTWRWRGDDGSESAATWLEVAAADHSFTISANQKARLRFALSNAGVANNIQPVLERGYNITVGFDLSAASSASQSASWGSDSLTGLWVSPDGLHAYCFDNVGVVREYSMSSAWNPSTLSSTGRSLSMTTQLGSSGYFFGCFKPDGLTLYAGNNASLVAQYTLGTAWNLSTASYASKQLDLDPLFGAAATYALDISDDGQYLYANGGTSGPLYKWQLTTAWDVSTGVYTGDMLDASAQGSVGKGICFRDGGLTLYIGSTTVIYQYTLTTPWMLWSATYASKSYTPTSEYDTHFNVRPDLGTKIICKNTNAIHTLTGHSLTASESYWQYDDVTTTSTKARAADSTNVTHAGDTTQQITSGTFISPNSGISETGTAGTDNDMDFTAASKCEAEYVIELVYDDITSGEDIRFRIKNADSRSSV